MRTSSDQGALDSLGHLCERLPAGVRDPHAHNGSLSTVGHDQDNPSRDRDAQIGRPKNNGLFEE